MRFITEDQFLKADKRVQDAIYDWWKPQQGDLFISNICGDFGVVRDEMNKEREEAILGNTTPLLTVGQLIESIEWKLKIKDSTDTLLINKYAYGYLFTSYNERLHLPSHQHDLLKALWLCAKEVASK